MPAPSRVELSRVGGGHKEKRVGSRGQTQNSLVHFLCLAVCSILLNIASRIQIGFNVWWRYQQGLQIMKLRSMPDTRYKNVVRNQSSAPCGSA